MKYICEKCIAMEKRGARRGYYLCEFSWGGMDKGVPSEDDERAYGPYCSRRCASVAMHRGAMRTKTCTMPYFGAKDSWYFARNAMPPSAAPDAKELRPLRQALRQMNSEPSR